jgi:hypothetical protein
MTIQELKADEKIIRMSLVENYRKQRRYHYDTFVEKTGIAEGDKILVDGYNKKIQAVVVGFLYHDFSHEIHLVSCNPINEKGDVLKTVIHFHPQEFKTEKVNPSDTIIIKVK